MQFKLRSLIAFFVAVIIAIGAGLNRPLAAQEKARKSRRDNVREVELWPGLNLTPAQLFVAIAEVQGGRHSGGIVDGPAIHLVDRDHPYRFRGVKLGHRYNVVAIDMTGKVVVDTTRRIWGDGWSIGLPKLPDVAVETSELQQQLDAAKQQYSALMATSSDLLGRLLDEQKKTDVLTRQVEALQRTIGGTNPEPISTFMASVGLVGQWNNRRRTNGDIPAFIRLTAIQGEYVRIDALPVLIQGTTVPSSINSFHASLLDSVNKVVAWAWATWDADKNGWVAVFYPNYKIQGGDFKDLKLDIDSSGFANQADAVESLSVIATGITWFDGVTTFSGPQYSSGTLIVSYE